ncbi:hypothetical protein PIB30_116050, partial [Stylosanthes scabra]|nr:hypothetical protein [Stylosanthes scabra]
MKHAPENHSVFRFDIIDQLVDEVTPCLLEKEYIHNNVAIEGSETSDDEFNMNPSELTGFLMNDKELPD